MSGDTGYVRRSARVALLDRTGAVLLAKSGFRRPIAGTTVAWFLPGGGVEPGETIVQAAVREIAEETGLALAPEGLLHLAFAEGDGQVGDLRGLMRDDVFVAPAPSTSLSTARLERHERDAFQCYRWWPLADLRHCDELVLPRRLATTLADYLAASSWPQPVRLPW